jgi:hypothetical protein
MTTEFDPARLILRLVVGFLFFGYGSQNETKVTSFWQNFCYGTGGIPEERWSVLLFSAT